VACCARLGHCPVRGFLSEDFKSDVHSLLLLVGHQLPAPRAEPGLATAAMFTRRRERFLWARPCVIRCVTRPSEGATATRDEIDPTQRPPGMSSRGARVMRCARSGCSVREPRSSGPRCPRRVANGCAVGAAVRRWAPTRCSCSIAPVRSTRSGCAARSRLPCWIASSSCGRYGRFAPAGSYSLGLASVTSSSAPRAWTCGPATGSGSSRTTEGPPSGRYTSRRCPRAGGGVRHGPGPHRLAA
jgi:hypothetical protein